MKMLYSSHVMRSQHDISLIFIMRKEDETVESRSFHKLFTFLITNTFHFGCDIYSASTMHSGDVLINIFLHPVPVPSLFDFSLE